MLNITQNIPKHRKDLRPLRQGIVAPAGYKVVACDSSQIEARVLAYIAGEYELLAQFREGRDPYAELAAKFGYGKNAKEVHDGAKAGDALCKTLRQAAKRLILSCWEEGTLVLTDRGWVPIEEITIQDKVFDGEAFCPHWGMVYNGIRSCESIGGSKVTPEHLIAIDEDHWQPVMYLDNEAAYAYGAQVLRNEGIELPVVTSDEHRDDTLMIGYTRRVFDIRNVGDRHQYIVQTRTGHVLVSHNCGYGTGAAKLADTLIRDRAMLSQDRAQHRQKARELHQLYRANNQNIVALWARRQKVIEHMVQGGEGWYGGPNNNLFHYGTMPVCGREAVPSIVLPSGFVLRYPNLRMEYNGGTHAEFYYDRPMGKNVVSTKTYGGSGVENDTQSLAFQILMYQAVRMSAAGIPLAVNIHDSFAAVVPEAEAESVAQRMVMFMSETPPWVEGLPLAAEAEIADDFTVV